jgi:hypothetical protein
MFKYTPQFRYDKNKNPTLYVRFLFLMIYIIISDYSCDAPPQSKTNSPVSLACVTDASANLAVVTAASANLAVVIAPSRTSALTLNSSIATSIVDDFVLSGV